ncbi:hypothetical protein QQ045_008892 [Rhodiola kirilowii]
MKHILRFIVILLTKELFRWCGHWRRLIVYVAIMTTAGIALQTIVLPHPLTIWSMPPPSTNYSEYTLINPAPTNQALSRVEHFHRVPFVPLVSVTSANVSNSQSSASLRKAEKIAATRRKKARRERKRQRAMPPPPPPPLPPPTPLQRYVSSLTPKEAYVYAHKELEHAPLVTDDPDLYSPLFWNVSLFKRSYELMELILKVYIYPDGRKPICHQPHLRGIYASEGWFMKLMHENRQFSTKDPEEAHLFYLPYSARQLQQALYVPDSHNLRPLSVYLRDFVKFLAAKYPFWNRTHGSDHFLVACHDWGPYTVNKHKELSRNTIKALCNADLSEGIFVSGKDISLPETTIRIPKKPLKNIGGFRVSLRPILAFFAGNMHGRVRPKLVEHWSEKDPDMRIYGPLPNKVARKMSYIQHMKSSRFCICPMGYEVNSPRIVEAIYYECVPVIIADNFVLPLSDVLDWSTFSLVVAERDIPKLKDILMAIPLRRYLKMQINVKMVQKHFLWNQYPIKYDLFHMILHSLWLSRLNHTDIPAPE